MPELADALATLPGIKLRQGKVGAVAGTSSQYVHIDYAGGRVLNAGKFDGATYGVGDYVWFLLDDESGALILGKQTPGTHAAAPTPSPATPITVTAASSATYDTTTGTWTAGTLVQSPTQLASWFYTAGAFSSLSGVPLGAVELEVTRSGGGPLELTTHRNSVGSGAYDGTGAWFGAPVTPVGVATWVPLPLDWGLQLATSSIRGVSIGGGTFSGTYSGTGRIRLTPTV